MNVMHLAYQTAMNERNPIHTELLTVLSQAYSSREEVAQFLWMIGTEPGVVPQQFENMRQFWQKMIDLTDRQGDLRRLVEQAANDPEVWGYKEQFEDILARLELPGHAEQNTEPSPWLDLRQIRGIPFELLTEAVRQELESFERRRRDYDAQQRPG